MPLLDLVSQAARLAWPLIRRGVREDIGADRLYRALRETYPGLRREEVRLLARAERQRLEAAGKLRFLASERRPDPSRLPLALTAQRREYSFLVELRGTDPLTGEAVTRQVAVATDELLTRREIEEEALRFLEEEPEQYGELEDVTALLIEGQRRG